MVLIWIAIREIIGDSDWTCSMDPLENLRCRVHTMRLTNERNCI
jgi:hypothetical protein